MEVTQLCTPTFILSGEAMQSDPNLKIKLKQEISQATSKLRSLEAVAYQLTIHSLEGERWRISTQAIELVSKAQQAMIELELLLSDVGRHWPS